MSVQTMGSLEAARVPAAVSGRGRGQSLKTAGSKGGGGAGGPGDAQGGRISIIFIIFSQGHRGNSLDRRPQGGPHLSGAVGEEMRPSMIRKLSDHPAPPPSQYPPAPPAQQHRYLQHPHFHQVPQRNDVGAVR